MLLQTKDDCHMKYWTLKGVYISTSIVNGIVTKMGQAVLCEILGEIKSCTCFSLIADEAADMSHNEQLSL